jgi:hypothetical protein
MLDVKAVIAGKKKPLLRAWPLSIKLFLKR